MASQNTRERERERVGGKRRHRAQTDRQQTTCTGIIVKSLACDFLTLGKKRESFRERSDWGFFFFLVEMTVNNLLLLSVTVVVAFDHHHR
jgi:hypothetical protein